MTYEEQAKDLGFEVVSVIRNIETDMAFIRYTYLNAVNELKIASSEIRSYEDAYKAVLGV